jgi:hypothetical protein
MTLMHVYADESRQQGERFMLIGGLWMPADVTAIVRQEIARVRAEERLTAEMKWKKVSLAKLNAYARFVEVFFSQPRVSFKCIVIDVTQLDYRTFAGGDDELGFYKFYFQLLSRKLALGNDYLVFTDGRHNRKRYRLDVLRICTNRWWAEYCGERDREPVRAIAARSSKDEDLIQLADVLLGAVGYVWNGYQSSEAKLGLIRYMENRLGAGSLGQPTLPSQQKFNIWHWQPSTASRTRMQKKRPDS